MKTLSLSSFVRVSLSLFALAGCASVQKNQAISSDDVAIGYDVYSAGEPALVFVHGWCCDKRYWDFQVPYFAGRYKVVAIDLAGHGRSGLGRENWTMEAFGMDVVAVVEKLELDRVILVGHSMGGSVIIEAARQMPNRVIGLIGIDTFHNFETEYPKEQIDEFIEPFKKDFVQRAGPFIRNMFVPGTNPELIEWIVTDMSSAPPWVGIGTLQEYFRYDVREALKEVRVPVYCINTDLLPTNVEAGRRHALSFEVKLMPGMSHFIMIEDQKTFNRLLTETIDELSR